MFVQKIPYQSVRRRRIRHWLLLLMRAAAIALIVAAFARPFLPQGAPPHGGDHRRQPRGRDHARPVGEHGLRRSLEEGRRGGAKRHRRRRHGSDKATLVLFGRNAEENVRATSDRGRLEAGARRGEGHLGRHALRARAQARREHPRALGAAAPRGHSHLRLPEDRLERRRRRALFGGREADADLGRRSEGRQHLGAVGPAARASTFSGPGARHRHGGHRQQERRGREQRRRSRSKWTASRSRRRR